MKDTHFLIFFLFLVVIACTSEPAVRIEEDYSLINYEVIDVVFAENVTGETFDFDIAEALTKHLKLQLKQKGYLITQDIEKDENVLIVKSSIVSYNPGSAFKRWLMPGAGKTQATVRTSLIDKKSGIIIGEMVNSEAVSSGGLYSVGANKWILEVIAKGIASEIDERLRNKF